MTRRWNRGLRGDNPRPASDQRQCNRHLRVIQSVQQKGGGKRTTPRPASLGEARRPDLFVPCVQPSRGSYSRHVCSPQVEVTTATHAWTALLTSQANHSLAYKLSNLSLAYKVSNPPWRPIKGSPHLSFSTHHLERRRVQARCSPLSRIGRV